MAVAALAVALGGWLRGPVSVPVRVLSGVGALILLYLDPLWIAIGLGRASRVARLSWCSS